MAIIASKWSMLIINALDHGPVRNGQLMRRIDGISQKMLTQTLRDLESFGLVVRNDARTIPPHVSYCLSPLGVSLRTEVRSFIGWVEGHLPELTPRPRGDFS
jgi:DNA-binding HxlR family transcriptional regulator